MMAVIRFVKLATCLAIAALTLASENELHDSSIESSSLLGRSEQIILDTTAHGRACQIAVCATIRLLALGMLTREF